MNKTRLEAFSDGVIAIILTIMVLELKVPKGHSFEALAALWPVFAAYSLSYVNVFLIWLNHHDIFGPMKVIDRSVLFVNGLLLFAASFVPFATAFAGEAHWNAPLPVAIYGLVMLAVSLAFFRLRVVASRCTEDRASKSKQLGESRTNLYLAGAFFVAICCTAFAPRLALSLYAIASLVGVVHRRHQAGGKPK
jgi:uncharacterized membrane protein